MPAANLVEYYSQRAAEYDQIYERPERQADLDRLRELVHQHHVGRRVLEVACGTGFWTQQIARVAQSVFASDVSHEVLEVARNRCYPSGRVRFAVVDAYALDSVSGPFNSGFAGFWWSHVSKMDLPRFLRSFHFCLGQGARVTFVDNRFIDSASTPIAARDESENTYQDRRLADGRAFRVLKNFPSEDELRTAVSSDAVNVEITWLQYYWYMTYEIRLNEKG